MGEIRMFEWCGNARDPFVVVPKSFKVEKLENPTDQTIAIMPGLRLLKTEECGRATYDISGPGWTRSPADLSALSDPFIAHPLNTQGGGAGSVQGMLRLRPPLVQVVPEHGRPLPGPGGHPQVREGCEAANQIGEIEHHGGDPEHASQLSLGR